MVIHMKKTNMKGMKKLSITVTAVVAAAVMALAGCGSGSGSGSSSSDASDSGAKTTKFVLGGLWPETGSLAYLAPPELAAEKLAVKDINDAGGVLDSKVTTVDADTSDADHADQNTSAAQSVLSKNPSFIIGPASSSVVKNTYKSITSQNIPMLSMGATSAGFSGLSDYFFRTVAPDTVQGAVMGNLIAQDGVQKLAIAVFNDEYGTGLRDTVVKTASAAGVDIVYGERTPSIRPRRTSPQSPPPSRRPTPTRRSSSPSTRPSRCSKRSLPPGLTPRNCTSWMATPPTIRANSTQACWKARKAPFLASTRPTTSSSVLNPPVWI